MVGGEGSTKASWFPGACSYILTEEGGDRLQKSLFKVRSAQERFHSGCDLRTGEMKCAFCRVLVGVHGFQQSPRSHGLCLSPWSLSG